MYAVRICQPAGFHGVIPEIVQVFLLSLIHIYLSQLSGFSAEQAENWTNGTVQDGVLTVADLSQPVTYTYYLDAARTQTVQFTLQPEEPLLPVDAVHFPDSAFRSYVQGLDTNAAVSYTHLDVYKRQAMACCCPPATMLPVQLL